MIYNLPEEQPEFNRLEFSYGGFLPLKFDDNSILGFRSFYKQAFRFISIQPIVADIDEFPSLPTNAQLIVTKDNVEIAGPYNLDNAQINIPPVESLNSPIELQCVVSNQVDVNLEVLLF